MIIYIDKGGVISEDGSYQRWCQCRNRFVAMDGGEWRYIRSDGVAEDWLYQRCCPCGDWFIAENELVELEAEVLVWRRMGCIGEVVVAETGLLWRMDCLEWIRSHVRGDGAVEDGSYCHIRGVAIAEVRELELRQGCFWDGVVMKDGLYWRW